MPKSVRTARIAWACLVWLAKSPRSIVCRYKVSRRSLRKALSEGDRCGAGGNRGSGTLRTFYCPCHSRCKSRAFASVAEGSPEASGITTSAMSWTPPITSCSNSDIRCTRLTTTWSGITVSRSPRQSGGKNQNPGRRRAYARSRDLRGLRWGRHAAVGIGGIMGGAQTEISSRTRNVLIECAWFDPIAIRRATRSLKLHTEASPRFGRGADPEMAEVASRRCGEAILQLAGGELLAGS